MKKFIGRIYFHRYCNSNWYSKFLRRKNGSCKKRMAASRRRIYFLPVGVVWFRRSCRMYLFGNEMKIVTCGICYFSEWYVSHRHSYMMRLVVSITFSAHQYLYIIHLLYILTLYSSPSSRVATTETESWPPSAFATNDPDLLQPLASFLSAKDFPHFFNIVPLASSRSFYSLSLKRSLFSLYLISLCCRSFYSS